MKFQFPKFQPIFEIFHFTGTVNFKIFMLRDFPPIYQGLKGRLGN
jgi:hypothetical protein